MKNEIWKEIPGFPGYEASNLGRLRSLSRKVLFARRGRDGNVGIVEMSVAGRILKPTLSLKSKNYKHFYVTPGKRQRKQYVHRLVWLAFRGEIPKGLSINHIDFNTENNSISNLEAVSHSQNIAHSKRAGRYSGWDRRKKDRK